MKLGAFSVSLSVKNLEESRVFYEKLGFKVFAGETEKNYLILKNEETIIGLFQGMFENNILTFNPGWDSNAHTLSNYDDAREIQQKLIDSEVEVINPIANGSSGPGSFMIQDPDGNTILIDQHV